MFWFRLLLMDEQQFTYHAFKSVCLLSNVQLSTRKLNIQSYHILDIKHMTRYSMLNHNIVKTGRNPRISKGANILFLDTGSKS